MSLTFLTLVHTALSLAGLVLGFYAIAGLLNPGSQRTATRWFLGLAVLATATGFLFPFTVVTPAFAVGLISTLVLVLTLVAHYAFGRQGIWHVVWVLGIVISVFFLAFVTIAQAFLKIGFLNALAPTGSEPPFAVAELVCLAIFAVLAVLALRRQRMAAG